MVGVTDDDRDAVAIEIGSVRQDEPTGGQADAIAGPGNTAQLRAERDGKGDGRVYYVGFEASDGEGGTCTGTVQVSVPHSSSKPAVGGGPVYDSLG